MRLKTVLFAGAVLAVSFAVSLKAIDWIMPRADIKPPVLAALPPLPAVRSSMIVVPVAIPLPAIRDLVERAAPRNFAGKANNPLEQILSNADIGWTATRGAITVGAQQSQLALSSPITGAMAVKGSLSSNAKGAVGNALGKLLGGNAAKTIGVNIKSFNASAEIKGSLFITARPVIQPNWRIEPGLNAQVILGDSSVSIAGARINVPAQVKPVIDKAINDQLASLQQRIREDSALERNARREWARLCRSIPLQGAGATQSFWLELRPTKAVAAQPVIDGSAVTLTLGIAADTRVTAAQTKPDCPFPATLEIVPPEAAGVRIAVPIDIPYAELEQRIEAAFAGKVFPADGSGPAEMSVRHATVAASGERLLLSLLVGAKNKSSLFGLSGEATLHVWGKPELDQAQQTLRLTGIELAAESESAFDMLGAAARAAVPALQSALADGVSIDLKPAATNAQRRLAAMVSDYQTNEDGLRVSSEVSGLRLTSLSFDAATIRVTAEAEGMISVAVTKLPGL